MKIEAIHWLYNTYVLHSHFIFQVNKVVMKVRQFYWTWQKDSALLEYFVFCERSCELKYRVYWWNLKAFISSTNCMKYINTNSDFTLQGQ